MSHHAKDQEVTSAAVVSSTYTGLKESHEQSILERGDEYHGGSTPYE